MTRRIARTKNQTGPLLLTPEVEERLVNAVRAGVPADVAAAAGGVSRSSLFWWLQRGRDELNRRDEGLPDDPNEQTCVDLYLKVEKARAEAITRNVLLVEKAASGGQVTEETTRRYRDAETGEMVEETTIKRTPIDWRAAGWYLERVAKGQFAKDVSKVELTGADGGPVQLGGGAIDTEELAARVAANIAAAAKPAIAAPVDAEIVEDTPVVPTG